MPSQLQENAIQHRLNTAWTIYYSKKQTSAAAVSFQNVNGNHQTQSESVSVKVEPPSGDAADKHPRLSSHNMLDVYQQNIHELSTFDTVNDFWSIYSQLQAPTDLPLSYNIYLFRANAGKPAWENFPDGGCWIVRARKSNGIVDRLWEELCFSAIAEWFNTQEVVGVVLSVRNRDDILSIWLTNIEHYMAIGERIKDLLNLDASTRVEFQRFQTAISEGSTFRNTQAYTYQPSSTSVVAPAVSPM